MITIASSKAALVALLLALPIAAGAGQAATPKTQTNREGPVTVKVTPRNLSPDASTWDFEITLDTHAVSLDQDLSRAAVLVDGQGNARSPLAWEGDPPGGHHRKGLLRFQPLPASTSSFELRISGIGGVEQRVFRWRLAE